jgi:uncharacterized Tic20 family protein
MDQPEQQHLPPQTPAPVPNKNEWTMGMLCHLSALAGYMIPFGNIAGPLIVWMLKRQEMPFVETEGKESVNFQISMLIYHMVAGLLCFLLIGFLLLPAVIVANIVFTILAALKAANGESYRYPFCLRFVS